MVCGSSSRTFCALVLGNHRSNNEVVSLGLIFLLIVGGWTFDWGSEFRLPPLSPLNSNIFNYLRKDRYSRTSADLLKHS